MACAIFGQRRVFYYVFVSVFAWAGFGMGISAISSQNWLEYEVNGEEYAEGLFQGKHVANNTKFSVERLSFIDATAGLYITSLIFAFAVAIMAVQGSRLFPKTYYTVVLVFVILATTMELVGVSVYQSNLDSGYSGSGVAWGSNSTVKIGYGLIAAWVVFCSHFMATIAMTIFYMQIDDWRSS